MPNTIPYHEDAVRYNAELAKRAEELALEIEDETVARWCRAVARQHRKHEGLHVRSIDRLHAEEANEVEMVVSGTPTIVESTGTVPVMVFNQYVSGVETPADEKNGATV